MTGTTGLVSAANSLVGNRLGVEAENTGGDGVGDGGVTALANGNYVVASPGWNNYQGAATWGNGTAGTIGTVSAANSLVGSTSGTGNLLGGDEVGGGTELGEGGITALTNGNYVVDSPYWHDQAGAVTWGNGTTGITGTVSAANSLVGISGDQVGSKGVTVLSNGNYVVDSPDWFGDEGAVTWGNGTTGIAGSVLASNSLVGNNSGDDVGFNGVVALPNGNYVVISPYWNQTTGAVTWGNGATGTVGTVSGANSFVDLPGVGIGAEYVSTLPDGNYVFVDAIPETAYATWFDGNTGADFDDGHMLYIDDDPADPDAGSTIFNGAGVLTVSPLSTGKSFLVGGSVFTFTVGFPDIAIASPPPTVSAISPTSGPTAGGTTVTITGSNLSVPWPSISARCR